MNEQEMLMRKISAVRFSMWELHIYLDTHPGDCAAAEKLDEYRQLAVQLTAQYEAAYGPLHETAETANRWAWIANPWPWDVREGDR